MLPSRLLVPVLLAALTLTLTGCGGEDADPSEAPRTNIEARGESGAADREAVRLDDPEPAPDVTVRTMEGDTISLARSTGDVLLVNFWATWCPPCRKEIPDLVSLQTDLGPEGLTVIGVATDDEGREVVRPFVNEHGVNYPIVIDSTQTLQSELGPVYGLPTTLLINPKGQVVKRVVGIFPADRYRPVLHRMLESAPAS
jgi:thiol-disulfide isomerase/thioredoxin